MAHCHFIKIRFDIFYLSGLPPFQPPPFSYNDTVTGNVTSFGGMITELGSAIAIIPLLGILENVAIAKAFGGHFHFYFLFSLLGL